MKIPFLPYEKLRPIAANFLEKYNSPHQIPVPIEWIIDNKFTIDIVPTPGLHQNFDIDSFITSDFTAIHVDSFVYESRPGRYHFSLAHELSHFLVHQDVFAQLSFSTTAEWKSVVKSIPERDYGLLEFQANSLAGLILVPPADLESRFRSAVQLAQDNGISIDDPSGAVIPYIEEYVSADFEVSSAVIHRRLEFDKLI
jgi:Zn-dependent peptidase ImmA (M78 family)